MERQFWPSFWTLVDGNNELQEIPLHYHAVPHRILWTIPKTRHRTFWWRTDLSSNHGSNLKLNIVYFWIVKCRKNYFRISIVNALPVNGHPTVIAVHGRMSFTANVNGPLANEDKFSLHHFTLFLFDSTGSNIVRCCTVLRQSLLVACI